MLAAVDLCKRVVATGGRPSIERLGGFAAYVVGFALRTQVRHSKGRLVTEELLPLLRALDDGRPHQAPSAIAATRPVATHTFQTTSTTDWDVRSLPAWVSEVTIQAPSGGPSFASGARGGAWALA